jgi:hypothetical protein
MRGLTDRERCLLQKNFYSREEAFEIRDNPRLRPLFFDLPEDDSKAIIFLGGSPGPLTKLALACDEAARGKVT